MAAWCELRSDFRTFRLDRIEDFLISQEQFRPETGKTLHDFLKRPMTWSRGARAPVTEDAAFEDG
jgi:predicted DNA-binding transcriptional regulator YafY